MKHILTRGQANFLGHPHLAYKTVTVAISGNTATVFLGSSVLGTLPVEVQK